MAHRVDRGGTCLHGQRRHWRGRLFEQRHRSRIISEHPREK